MHEKYPLEEAASILRIIAHPVRLRIIILLEKGKMNTGEIQSAIGAKQSTTSQHLNAMASKGILARERERNKVYYYIRKKETVQLLSCIKGCCRN